MKLSSLRFYFNTTALNHKDTHGSFHSLRIHFSKRHAFLIVVTLFSLLSHGQFQEKLDSLKKVTSDHLSAKEKGKLFYNQAWYAYALNRPHESIDFARKSFNHALDNRLDTLVHKSGLILSSVFINVFNYDSAVFYATQTNEYIDQHLPNEFLPERARMNIILADALANQLKYSEAINIHQSNLKIVEELNDTAAIVISLLSQSRLYKDVGIYSMALKCLQQSERYINSPNYKSQRGTLYAFSGSIYAAIENYDKAIKSYKIAIDQEKLSEPVNELMIGDYYFNLSEIHLDLGQYDETFYALDQAKRIFEKREDNYRISAAKIRESKIFVELGKLNEAKEKIRLIDYLPKSLQPEYYITNALLYQEDALSMAIQYADSSKNSASEINDLQALKYSYELLSEFYERDSNWKKGYESKKKYVILSDSLMKRNELINLQRLEIKQVIKNKDAVIAQKNNGLRRETLRSEQLIWISLVIAALAIIIILIFILRGIKTKQGLVLAENKQLLNEKRNAELKKEIQDFSLTSTKHLHFIQSIHEKLNQLRYQNISKQEINGLFASISNFLITNEKTEKFKERIDLIENTFFDKISSHAKLTKTEKKLCTLLKLEMSSKEISEILNVSEKTIEVYRSRLRKKLNITSTTSFTDFFNQL